MNLKTIKELAYKHMINRKPHDDRERGYIYYHGERVARLSIELRKKLFPNDNKYDQHIVVASLFHDVGKGLNPHAEYGAVLVKEILKGHCEEDEIEIIAEIIGYHQTRRKENDYPEYVKIVQDADILDRFGTLEIWLNFQKSAHQSAPISSSLEFYRKDFEGYAKYMRDILNYNLSKEILDEKIEFSRSFIKRLEVEAQGAIY